MKLFLGLIISLVVGVGCRVFDIPVPSPPVLPGALLVVAMTIGYSSADRLLSRTARVATTKHLCGAQAAKLRHPTGARIARFLHQAGKKYPMNTGALPNIVKYAGEDPMFQPGERVRISIRFPVGHYRVPRYIRGKSGVVETVITPKAVNNEDEGFGLNAGLKGYYYRVAIPLTDLWSGYAGSSKDNLRIEVFENWLERTD